MTEFTLDELRHLAAKARLPEHLVVTTARETVHRFREIWHAEKANLPMAAKVASWIDACAPTVPLLGELAKSPLTANGILRNRSHRRPNHRAELMGSLLYAVLTKAF